MQNLSRLADEQLVAAYADGNNEAFDTLLTRHQSRVFSYIFNIVKNREPCRRYIPGDFCQSYYYDQAGQIH